MRIGILYDGFIRLISLFEMLFRSRFLVAHFLIDVRLRADGARIFDAVVFDCELAFLLPADESLLLRDLLGEIDRDIAEALELARQPAPIDEVPGADQRQLFGARRQNVVLAIDDSYATFGAAWNAFAHRLDVELVILSDMHHALARQDFELDILWNELHFHFFIRSEASRISFCRLSESRCRPA